MPNDLDKLQGTWHITSLETDGAKMRASQFSDATVVIAGSRFTSLGMGQTYEGTVELGRAKKLKTFDLVFTAGPKRASGDRLREPRRQDERQIPGRRLRRGRRDAAHLHRGARQAAAAGFRVETR